MQIRRRGTLRRPVLLAPPRSPSSIPGLTRWAVAEDSGTADGLTLGDGGGQNDRVSGSWGRLDGNSNGPTMRRNHLNGRAAWEFLGNRGNAMRDSAASVYPTSGFTVWAVAARRSSGGGSTPIVVGADDSTSAGGRTHQLGWANATQARFVTFDSAAGARQDLSAVVSRTVPHALIGIVDGSTLAGEIFTDGSSDGGTTALTNVNGGSKRTTVGAVVLANSTYHYSGFLYEWGVYDHALSPSERAFLNSYIQDRYGIIVSDYVPPPGTVTSQADSFTGANGSAPSTTNFLTAFSSGSTAAIQNNALQMKTGSNGGYADVARVTSKLAAATNSDIFIDWTPTTLDEAYASVMTRDTGANDVGANGYKFELSSFGSIAIQRVASYSGTTLTSGSVPGFAAGVQVHLRIKTTGPLLQVWAWTSGSQPTAPTIEISDSAITNVGKVGFFLNGGSAAAPVTWLVDNWSATTVSS